MHRTPVVGTEITIEIGAVIGWGALAHAPPWTAIAKLLDKQFEHRENLESRHRSRGSKTRKSGVVTPLGRIENSTFLKFWSRNTSGEGRKLKHLEKMKSQHLWRESNARKSGKSGVVTLLERNRNTYGHKAHLILLSAYYHKTSPQTTQWPMLIMTNFTAKNNK